jgi:hypothetical protein
MQITIGSGSESWIFSMFISSPPLLPMRKEAPCFHHPDRRHVFVRLLVSCIIDFLYWSSYKQTFPIRGKGDQEESLFISFVTPQWSVS